MQLRLVESFELLNKRPNPYGAIGYRVVGDWKAPVPANEPLCLDEDGSSVKKFVKPKLIVE